MFYFLEQFCASEELLYDTFIPKFVLSVIQFKDGAVGLVGE